ncbi:MAG: rod shape-determining protein MreD [Clostridia bacterium]|nr:rod shape-determining protein MreD [Clostridia bacterium]
MQRSRKKIFTRYVIYIIELLFVFALEQVLASRLSFCGLYMFLLIPVFVSISLFERENTGMIFGILTGVLIDYGSGSGIGISAVLFCVVGYFLGMISNYILRANILTEIVVSAFLILVVYSFGTFFSVWDFNSFGIIWKENFWKDLLASVSVFVPAFYFNRVISYRFGGDEEVVD